MDVHNHDSRNLSIIVLGDSQVGKTSMILRYTEDKFTGSFSSTLGLDFKLKKTTICSQPVKLQIWDTSGQERFRTITKTYYRKAMGVVLVYDCTDPKSYREIKDWIAQIDSHARPDIVKVLVAAKCDREDLRVTPKMGQALADEYGIRFFLSSAKTGQNVAESFEYVAEQIVRNKVDVREKRDSFAVEVTSDELVEKRKNGCC